METAACLTRVELGVGIGSEVNSEVRKAEICPIWIWVSQGEELLDGPDRWLWEFA